MPFGNYFVINYPFHVSDLILVSSSLLPRCMNRTSLYTHSMKDFPLSTYVEYFDCLKVWYFGIFSFRSVEFFVAFYLSLFILLKHRSIPIKYCLSQLSTLLLKKFPECCVTNFWWLDLKNNMATFPFISRMGSHKQTRLLWQI